MANPWIYTYTGRQFFFLAPTADMICIEDMAHALARKCRFGGHVHVPHYSVAEHSVRVSWITEIHGEARAGLLHDAGETYLPDLASPLKHGSVMGDHFCDIENGIMRVVSEKYGVPPCKSPAVQEADLIMLATEAEYLMGAEPNDDFLQGGRMPDPLPVNPWAEHGTWDPELAERRFLDRWAEVMVGDDGNQV